jgi:type I restriction enzyme, R subunit
VGALDAESNRAVREALDEESLAVYDLLKKPQLSGSDIKRIKTVADELLRTLKAQKLQVDHWQDKEATRDAVYTAIYKFLRSDETGLPSDYYSPEDVREPTDEIFRHVYRVYPRVAIYPGGGGPTLRRRCRGNTDDGTPASAS